jgi:undecaprenyl-diphosphatase
VNDIDILQAVVLAVIQGITEWLPISSSAHLALAQQVLNVNPPILFDILLHVGTIIAVMVFMRSDIAVILRALLKADTGDENFRIAVFIAAASIPTAIIGFVFRDFFESMFTNPKAVGIALIITGIFLFNCEFRKGSRSMSAPACLLVGFAQGASVAPGISRSGATIGTALLLGVEREKAARFSFLLSIPAIFGATLFELKDASLGGMDSSTILAASAVSALVGYFTIGFFLEFVKEKGMRPFSYYCMVSGALAYVLLA